MKRNIGLNHSRDYLNDFVLGDDGAYTYVGARHRSADDPRAILRRRGTAWLYLLLCAAAAIVPGCLTAPAMMYAWYVIIAYAVEVFSAGSLIWAIARLGKKQELRHYEFQKTVEEVPVRSFFLLVGLAAGTVCTVVFLALNGFQNFGGQYALLFAAKALSFFGCLRIRSLISGEDWKPVLPAD